MDMTTQDGRPHRGQDQREVASGRLDADDLARFEGEGGPEAPELAAPEPQDYECIIAKQKDVELRKGPFWLDDETRESARI